jgi:hypothetical protein
MQYTEVRKNGTWRQEATGKGVEGRSAKREGRRKPDIEPNPLSSSVRRRTGSFRAEGIAAELGAFGQREPHQRRLLPAFGLEAEEATEPTEAERLRPEPVRKLEGRFGGRMRTEE